jgi:hypothetical protein
MLADLELPLVQEINTLEKRVLAEHKPPGMAGSLLQNLGRRPFRLALWGIAAGENASSFIEGLDSKYREGQPLPFTADIVADARLEQVIIQDMRVQELAGKPQRFAYVLTLREYIEPVEAEDPSLIEPDILQDAQNLMAAIDLGLDFGLVFATGLEQFVPTMSEFLKQLQEFRKAIS